jgi:cytochrome P450
MTGGVTLSRRRLRRPWRRRRGSTTPRALELTDPRVIQDEFPYLEELRQLGPVHWLPSHDAWLVLSYADAEEVLANPDRFGQNPGHMAGEPMMSGADPQVHAAARRLLGARLGPERIDRIVAEAQERSVQLVRQAVCTRRFDAVEAFAQTLAGYVGARLLGADPPAAGSASAVSFPLDTPLAAELRAAGGLSDTQAHGLLREFWTAATLTIGLALPSAILLLLEQPELQARLRSDYKLLDRFVDEALRLHPPARTLTRVALTDGDLAGSCVRAGSSVIVSITAANRDPTRFEQPAGARLDRPAQHLAFGAGPHRCPGAALGRRTMAVGLRSLLGAGPGLRAAQDLHFARWLDTGVAQWLHGLERLWITWD